MMKKVKICPQLIWVDGPTASGKDYLIANLNRLFKDNTELSVTNLRAADYAILDLPSEERKYTSYNTPDALIEKIYQNHLTLLKEIHLLLNDDVTHTDLIIVNRSFNSFLLYNIWQKDREELRNKLLRDYGQEYQNLLSDINSLYIQTTLPYSNLVEYSETILDRIKSREDSKDIDPDWIYKLVTLYHTRGHELGKLTTHEEYINSGLYLEIFKKYFSTLIV